MKTNESKILITGSWLSTRDCPDTPANARTRGAHYFEDVSSKPGSRKGELLVTSKCKYCGGIIADCPTNDEALKDIRENAGMALTT